MTQPTENAKRAPRASAYMANTRPVGPARDPRVAGLSGRGHRRARVEGGAVSSMTIRVSRDEGRTWSRTRIVVEDERGPPEPLERPMFSPRAPAPAARGATAMAPDPAVARIVRKARAETGRCPACGKAPRVSGREDPQPKADAWVVITGRCACTPASGPAWRQEAARTVRHYDPHRALLRVLARALSDGGTGAAHRSEFLRAVWKTTHKEARARVLADLAVSCHSAAQLRDRYARTLRQQAGAHAGNARYEVDPDDLPVQLEAQLCAALELVAARRPPVEL